MKYWFAVQVLAGREHPVKNLLLKVLQEFDFKIIIPQTEKFEWVRGAKMVTSRILFPGYLLLHGELTVSLYGRLKSLPGVCRVICNEFGISKIHDKELYFLLGLMDGDGKIAMTEIKKTNEGVVFVKGPLCGNEKFILKINKRKLRAYLNIGNIFDVKKLVVGLYYSDMGGEGHEQYQSIGHYTGV